MAENIYEIPTDMNLIEAFFGMPQKWTDGMFINVFITGIFGTLFISSMIFVRDPRKASLYSSFGTFITVFLLTMLSGFSSVPIAGGNQLIPAAILLIITIIWNRAGGGRFA
jgi:hypothetical protein